MNNSEWRALVGALRKRFPVEQPVVVRRCQSKNNNGMTRFDGRTFRVRIASNQPRDSLIDSLLHEWAHVRMIDNAYRHDGQWGVVYAEIYNSWSNDFETHAD